MLLYIIVLCIANTVLSAKYKTLGGLTSAVESLPRDVESQLHSVKGSENCIRAIRSIDRLLLSNDCPSLSSIAAETKDSQMFLYLEKFCDLPCLTVYRQSVQNVTSLCRFFQTPYALDLDPLDNFGTVACLRDGTAQNKFCLPRTLGVDGGSLLSARQSASSFSGVVRTVCTPCTESIMKLIGQGFVYQSICQNVTDDYCLPQFLHSAELGLDYADWGDPAVARNVVASVCSPCMQRFMTSLSSDVRFSKEVPRLRALRRAMCGLDTAGDNCFLELVATVVKSGTLNPIRDQCNGLNCSGLCAVVPCDTRSECPAGGRPVCQPDLFRLFGEAPPIPDRSTLGGRARSLFAITRLYDIVTKVTMDISNNYTAISRICEKKCWQRVLYELSILLELDPSSDFQGIARGLRVFATSMCDLDYVTKAPCLGTVNTRRLYDMCTYPLSVFLPGYPSNQGPDVCPPGCADILRSELSYGRSCCATAAVASAALSVKISNDSIFIPPYNPDKWEKICSVGITSVNPCAPVPISVARTVNLNAPMQWFQARRSGAMLAIISDLQHMLFPSQITMSSNDVVVASDGRGIACSFSIIASNAGDFGRLFDVLANANVVLMEESSALYATDYPSGFIASYIIPPPPSPPTPPPQPPVSPQPRESPMYSTVKDSVTDILPQSGGPNWVIIGISWASLFGLACFCLLAYHMTKTCTKKKGVAPNSSSQEYPTPFSFPMDVHSSMVTPFPFPHDPFLPHKQMM